MKVKLFKTEGNLNPLPVMSKDAFIAFAREWCDYICEFGLYPQINIPNERDFHKYFDRLGGTSYLHVGIPVGKGFYSIASMKGYCENPHMPGFDVGVTIPSMIGNSNSISVETLTDSTLSNIIFETIISPQSPKGRKLGISIEKKSNVEGNIEELLAKTKQMVYSRSALLNRGLFGGYYL